MTRRETAKRIRTGKALLVLVALLALLPATAPAQEPSEGKNTGNYNVKQSFEFGGRITDFSGNEAVYRTFVNLRAGPRLLEHTLEMRSLNHQGLVFDDLFLSSFGYGGDPNSVSRLRIYKNRWYNFAATFRMDRNLWDYNLLANPLNPTNSNPFVPITVSLHKAELVRRLSDYNLTLMPQSAVRLRLAYSRGVNEGPAFSTFHEGTDVLVFQPWKSTLNSYSFGVDFRMLPKTSISYDQFFHFYKGDSATADTVGTTQLGVPRFFAQLSNGTPVDLGIIFNTTAGQPCSPALTSTTTSPPTANAGCNGYLAYTRVGNVRTDYPTEQLSFQTSYFPNLDLSGRLVYSSSQMDVVGYQEFYQGLVTRTRQRQFEITGPASGKRVAVTADLGATVYLTDRFRIVDSFRFHHFRIPGFFNETEVSLFPSTTTISMLTAPASFPTTTPQHSTSSPADVLNDQFSRFLGQDLRFHQIDFLYDFSRRYGGHLGYRYQFREITERFVETADRTFFPTLASRGLCAAGTATAALCTTLANGSRQFVGELENDEEVETINEHTALFGFWARPNHRFRASFDLQLMSADRSFTRISPRHQQVYKLRASYRPADWASINGSINILEKRNNVTEVFHKQHSRTYGFNVSLAPHGNWGLDFGYDFNDIFSQTNICFTGTVRPPGTSPCPTAAALLQQISIYDHDTHFGYFDVMWKPVKRLTTTLGYTISSTTGETLILTPNAPAGPLQFNYHQPRAALELDLGQGFTGKASWGYYGYNEKAPPDPTTSPRDFRGNLVLLSVRYAFQ